MERLSRWHLWCSNTARSDSCWKTDIYAVTLGCFKLKWHREGSLHWVLCSCTMRWCIWQLLRGPTIHAYRTYLDKWDTWQRQPLDLSEVAAEGTATSSAPRRADVTHNRFTIISLFYSWVRFKTCWHWISISYRSSHIMKSGSGIMIRLFDRLWLPAAEGGHQNKAHEKR